MTRIAYKFGHQSLSELAQTHPSLVKLCHKVLDLQLFDFGITCGHRTFEAQNRLFFEGRSKVRFPNSKHNSKPSEAVDFILYVNGKPTYDPKDHAGYYMAVGVFRAVAASLNLHIRVGADWDGDFSTQDQRFHDLVHIQLQE